MLLPIGDDNQGRNSTPFVVYIIVAINVFVFLVLQQATAGEAGAEFTYAYSVVPYEITHNVDLVAPVRGHGGSAIPQFPGPSPIWLTILTSMFMHGGWMHIIGNMLYLWIFGDNIEHSLGHGRYLVFYLLCGIAAALAQSIAAPTSVVPMIGASGAISGVLGAYLVLHPRANIRVFVFLIF